MRRSLSLMRTALNHADLCLGQHTLAVFRSPAFNFDPVNTFKQQAAFAQRMRPIVEEFGAVFVDLFPATLRAAFPPPSVPDATLRAAFPPPSVPDAEQIASMQVLTTAPCHLFPTGRFGESGQRAQGGVGGTRARRISDAVQQAAT